MFTEVTDDSCHHYIIPLDKLNEWNEWYDSQDAEDGIEPDYAVRLDGGRLCFPSWEIR